MQRTRPTLELSLAQGGPFYRLTRAAGLVERDADGNLHVGRLAWVCALGTWVPWILLAAVDQMIIARPTRPLWDLSIHARLLLAAPCFVLADRALDARCRECVERLVRGGFLPPSSNRLATAVTRADRLRDSAVIEGALLVVSLGIGQLVLWRGLQGLLRSMPVQPMSATHVWYAGIALPVVQFLLLRQLWHWVLWIGVLASVARAHLRLIPYHPDRCGGLKFLESAPSGFVWVALGLSIVNAATWVTKIVHEGASATRFEEPFVLLMVIVLVVAYGPLFLFSTQLATARRRGLHLGSDVGASMARIFEDRWFDPTRGPGLIDTDNSSAMIDYSMAFDNVDKIRLVPVGLRAVVSYLVVVALPSAAVVIAAVPRAAVVDLLARVLLG